ncbi:hypothetical protein MGG_05463 [Pyricularia oryzae 70-15]|uniref:PPPDE domain-containing protein n=1 Tax=Pyricularia oryzae (strain 70-15 / ATCC MYA-4617 / FGSC 8958) TaxID=242507 RepID=G4MLT9_PYRO7|nr:uncharacterized protein MGG_05463 [Pyricularia oryzae 70-15]EHA57717.1 hypothetical protein MGG_05463 [Pyricularia oryzae 70-15]
MGFDAWSKKLTKASEATQQFINKKWEEGKETINERRARAAAEEEAAKAAAAEAQLAKERNEFLAPIKAKLEASSSPAPNPAEAPAAESTARDAPGAATSYHDMEQPLEFSRDSHKAVLLVTTPIEFGPIELSKQSYRLLARHVGMSMDSICHWALCVIDRGVGKSWAYDLMSDRLELNMIGKNVFRINEVTPEYVQTWSSAYYVGETTKSHEEVKMLGETHMALNPKYSLLESNCQHLAETLMKALCDGRIVSQHKLDEELKMVSPKMAMDMMMNKLDFKLDSSDSKGAVDSNEVKNEVNIIGELWGRVKKYRNDDKKSGKEEKEKK